MGSASADGRLRARMGVRLFVVKNAGLVDNARKLVNDGFTIEFFGVSDANERQMGASKELFHVFRVVPRIARYWSLIELDGADGA